MTSALSRRVRQLEADACRDQGEGQEADLSLVSDEDLERLEILLTRLEQGPDAEAQEEAQRILNESDAFCLGVT